MFENNIHWNLPSWDLSYLLLRKNILWCLIDGNRFLIQEIYCITTQVYSSDEAKLLPCNVMIEQISYPYVIGYYP